MQKELQEKIDLLLEMAGNSTNYDALVEEITDLEKEIEEKKLKVKAIKKSMKESKYLRDNDRIIDENIKVGLENKKEVYQNEYDVVCDKIEKSSFEEEETHESIVSLQSRIQSLQSLLETLQNKMKVVHQNSALSSFYEKMMDQTTTEIEELEKKKKLLTVNYEKIQDRLEFYGNKRNDLIKKLDHIKDRLSDTLVALSTPNFYVDSSLKKKDEDLVDQLNEELESLEFQYNRLLSEPVYIANEAIQALNNDDFTATLSWIKKLVTLIQSKPYMTSDVSQLDELLEQAISTRDEFVNVVEHNSYMGKDEGILDRRIQYLLKKVEDLKETEKSLKEKIANLDQTEVITLLEALSETEKLYSLLKEEYEEYKQVLFLNDEDKSPRKKSSLQAAYKRKKEELDVVSGVLANYQQELEETIFESQRLEMDFLKSVQEKIKALQEEVQTLQSKKEKHTRIKDILAIEKDKVTLKKLNDDVEAIQHRLKYKKSAEDIYDEFEMTLYSSESLDSKKDQIHDPVNSNFINLNDFRIENLEEEVSVPESSYSFVSNDNIDSLEPLFKEEVETQKVFPPRKSIESIQSDRLKVVNVEPLINKEELDSSKEEKKTANVEVPISDFNETPSEEEYISFNDILSGGTKDEN